MSILKFTGRSIFRSLNSCRGARMVSTLNKSSRFSSDKSVISTFYSSYSPYPRIPSDVSRFSASPSPWLMLSPRSRNASYDLYSFAENRVLSIPKPDSGSGYATRVVGSSHGWLAFYNRRRREVFLSNPLSGRRVNLPPIHNLSIPEFCLKLAGGSIQKIIISCPDPESEECRAIMSFSSINGLAFCCPGRSATEWTIIRSPQPKSYQDFQDFVYCELLFSIKHTNELEAWDLRNPLSPSLVWSNGGDSCGQSNLEGIWLQEEWLLVSREYIVVSQQGELFIVRRYINPCMLPDGSCATLKSHKESMDIFRYPAKTVNFDVHKIVREGDGWKRVHMDGHLDGLVMFVGGPSAGMALPAADADGFQPNSICFTDDANAEHGTDNGIFDYKKKTFSSCYYPLDYQSLKNKISPPPLWLAPNQVGNKIKKVEENFVLGNAKRYNNDDTSSASKR